VLTAVNKWRVTAIWIDVHAAGETRPTRHMHPTLSLHMVPDHMYLTRSMHSNLSQSHQQQWRAIAPEKKGSWHNPQHVSWPIRRSIPYFSPKTVIEAMGVKPPSIDGRLLGLPGPYHRHTIGMFNTCSRRWTRWSLTDTSGGYNHLRAPPGLRLSNLNIASSEMV
jgi:hypothetical protein